MQTADLEPRYQQREFLVEEMPDVLAAAAVVISRAGMGTLSELAALGKASLVVPIPASHQEPNAQAFARGGGALVFQQESLSPELLVSTIRDLLDDPARRETLGAAMRRVMPLDAADAHRRRRRGACSNAPTDRTVMDRGAEATRTEWSARAARPRRRWAPLG